MGDEEKVIVRKPRKLSEQRLENKISKKARQFKQGGLTAESLTRATQNSAEYVNKFNAGEEAELPPTPTEGESAVKPIWDSVEDLRQQCWVLYASGGNNHHLIRSPEVAKSEFKADMLQLGRQLLTDMNLAKGKLESLHALHNGRTGDATNPDEHFRAAAIGNEYVNWLTNFSDVVIPLTIDISEIAAKAVRASSPETAAAIVENIAG